MMTHHDTRDDHHDDYGGLQRDLLATGATMDRRRVLHLAAHAGVGLGLLRQLGCADSVPSPTSIDNSTTATVGSCSRIPEETQGPYPADASNGPNVLNLTGIVRRDITTSFAGLRGTSAGIPLTIALTLVSATTCAPLANRAVYLWHCDRAGLYSLSSAGVTSQNYRRGAQESDASGRLTFTSMFPACHAGRWPHLHFAVYPSLATATRAANTIATSQTALPKAMCDFVYATTGYMQSVTNLSQISRASDDVFSDGASLELATMSGTVADGLTATLTIAVNA